jgi:hypothetical protein
MFIYFVMFGGVNRYIVLVACRNTITSSPIDVLSERNIIEQLII